jgi:hypothetical protein
MKAGSLGERHGGVVVGIDQGLDSVNPQILEAMIERCRHRLGRVIVPQNEQADARCTA